MRSVIAGLLVAACICSPAWAQDSTIYTYDALGRLTQVSTTGAETASLGYSLDAADNRSSTSTSASGARASNHSFEAPGLGSSFQYNPPVSGGQTVQFSANSGIAANGSAFGFVSAPEGTQVAFLRTNGSGIGTFLISISGLQPGATYRAAFMAARRPGYGANPVSLSLAGTGLGSFSPASNQFEQFNSNSFVSSGTSLQILFSGSANSSDVTTAVDAVAVYRMP